MGEVVRVGEKCNVVVMQVTVHVPALPRGAAAKRNFMQAGINRKDTCGVLFFGSSKASS